MKYFKTFVSLPPGTLPGSLIREFFHRVFVKYSWFRPVQYGQAFTDGRLDPDRIDFDALVAFYEEHRDITVMARTERDYLILYPVKPGDPPYLGHLIWATSVKEATKPAWRAAHLQQVLEVMQLLRAPLAQAGLSADLTRKTSRHVLAPDGLSMTETFTVRDYGEGLPGLVWRNFFGPPFVQMFGERLTSLPDSFKQDPGSGIVLVQPYELPSQAGTPEATASERELIAHLGPECFYDHERHLKPTRVPDLTSLQPA
jgi:hypothetical protein